MTQSQCDVDSDDASKRYDPYAPLAYTYADVQRE